MRTRLKRLLLGIPFGSRVFVALRLHRHFVRIGWIASAEGGLAVDGQGSPIPWFTYPAIRFLEDRIREDMTVFEYGSGNSTRWLSQRVKSVTSCEHDSGWFDALRPTMPGNVEYIHRELTYGGDYARTIVDQGERFDVAIIDGRDRVNAARNAVEALTSVGVIVWDDADRSRYAEGRLYLRDNGFRSIEFVGLRPLSTEEGVTAIHFRDNNCFGI